MSAPRGVSIIIPSFNGQALLERCLPPLIEELRTFNGPCEVLVIDDGSTDGTEDRLKEKFPSVRVLRAAQRSGFQSAVSLGYRNARHPLLYFLNNDVETKPGFLAPLMRHFESQDVFAVCSRSINPGEEEPGRDRLPTVRFRMGFWWQRYEEISPALGRSAPILFVTMGHGMFRKEMLDSLGFLDPRFEPFYFEDQDICFRAWRRGWQCIYEPASLVQSRYQGTIGKLYSKGTIAHILWRNRFLFQWKNVAGWEFRLREVFWLPILALAAPLRGEWSFSTGLIAAFFKHLRLPRQLDEPGMIEPRHILKVFRRPFKSRYRVLFLHDYAILGGAERSLILLAGGLSKDRFDPVVGIAENGPLHARLRSSGVEAVRLDFPPLGPLRLLRWLWRSLGLRRWMGRHDIDLVHGNTPRSNLYAWLAGRLAGVPVVWHIRNVLEPGMRDIESRLQSWPDRILCNSAAVRARFEGRRGPQDPRVIYTGVDTDQFRPLTAPERDWLRESLGLKNELAVAIVGRIGAKQGHEEFLRAAKLVSQKAPACRFFVLGSSHDGEGPEWEQKARMLVDELGLGSKVEFMGHRDDVGRIIGAMDVLAFPSRYEAFSRAVLEAMACAAPVVATRVGGMIEAVEDGVTGRLVPPKDPERLASAILELADDPAKRRSWGEAARSRTERLFSAAETVRRVEDVYMALLEGFPRDRMDDSRG